MARSPSYGFGALSLDQWPGGRPGRDWKSPLTRRQKCLRHVALRCVDQGNPGKVKDALRKLGDKKLRDNASQAVPKILPCLANSKPDVVCEALKTLAVIGNLDAVPAILPLLTNERPDIVHEACRALANIGDKETIPSIEPLLMNSRQDIANEARKAILRLRAKS